VKNIIIKNNTCGMWDYPHEEALFKGVYLAVVEVTRKWASKIKDWPLILSELSIYFEDRVGGYL
jgi:putative transposase